MDPLHLKFYQKMQGSQKTLRAIRREKTFLPDYEAKREKIKKRGSGKDHPVPALVFRLEERVVSKGDKVVREAYPFVGVN